MANGNVDSKVAILRLKYGTLVVFGGFLFLLLVFAVALYSWTSADDVVAVLTPLTAVVGTIVGAFFGIQVGAAGKEEAEADRRRAEAEAGEALFHLSRVLPITEGTSEEGSKEAIEKAGAFLKKDRR